MFNSTGGNRTGNVVKSTLWMFFITAALCFSFNQAYSETDRERVLRQLDEANEKLRIANARLERVIAELEAQVEKLERSRGTPRRQVVPSYHSSNENRSGNRHTERPTDLSGLRRELAGIIVRKNGLSEDVKLNWAAQKRAEEMVNKGYYGHFDPYTGVGANYWVRASGYGLPAEFSEIGNNVESYAMGPTADDVGNQWENSPPHRDHLYRRENRRFGVGTAVYSQGQYSGHRVWTYLAAP